MFEPAWQLADKVFYEMLNLYMVVENQADIAIFSYLMLTMSLLKYDILVKDSVRICFYFVCRKQECGDQEPHGQDEDGLYCV